MIVVSGQGRRMPTLAQSALRVDARAALGCALPSALVFALASFHGGYYPRAWGWGALAALVVAVVALLKGGRVGLSQREWLTLVALAMLLAWIAATAVRPNIATRAVPELERGFLYLAVLWAALLMLRGQTVDACVRGLVAGIAAVSCAGLGRYLFPGGAAPDPFEGRLLFQPLGYANAAGIVAAMGVLLALGLAAHGRSLAERALAAGVLVPLVATVAFTGSRGTAGALALAVGVVLALDPARRRFAATMAATLPLPLLAGWVGSRSHVGDSQADAAVVAHDGHVMAALLTLLAVAVTLIARVLLRDGGRVRANGRLGLVVLFALPPLGLAVGAAAASRAVGALGDRPAYWRAAWLDYLAHPLFGSGAGSFGAAWLRYRTTPAVTLDAHNLYLETLAELGPLGLVLLLAMLVMPLLAVAAARRQPLGVPAAGAYAAFLVHAAVDWDWEMPAVTVVALLTSAVLLAGDRRPRRSMPVALCVAASLALTGVTAVGLVGNSALAAAATKANAGSWPQAQRLARTAARWAPWSAESYVVLGDAQLAQGDRASARMSFARAVELDGQDWRSWYELASVSPRGAQRTSFEQIARLNPLVVQSRLWPR